MAKLVCRLPDLAVNIKSMVYMAAHRVHKNATATLNEILLKLVGSV